MTTARDYLGQTLTIHIDRPLGSRHPTFGHEYFLNYGYLPGVIGGDGEELDAYLVGVDHPVDVFTGVCIAVIHRLDEDDDKLVIAPIGTTLSLEEIRTATAFQEQYFNTEIWI
jgi:inorganic pyrophosphatase